MFFTTSVRSMGKASMKTDYKTLTLTKCVPSSSACGGQGSGEAVQKALTTHFKENGL